MGTLIALTYLLTFEDPYRFARARMWAATWDCRPGILRTLLVQGAYHILGPFGADHDLRR